MIYKRGQKLRFRSNREYIITRISKEYVWVRWGAYGPNRWGLSVRYRKEDLEKFLVIK